MNARGDALTNEMRLENYKPQSNSLFANYLLLQMSETDARIRAQLLNRHYSANRDANYLTMDSTATYNRLWLMNRQFGSDAAASNIYLNASATANSAIIYNRQTSGNQANQISLGHYSSYNQTSISNFKWDATADSDLANIIEMLGYPFGSNNPNTFSIKNYDVNGNQIANEIVMSKSENANTAVMRIRRGGDIVAVVQISRSASGYVQIEIGTRSNSSFNYRPATIFLDSNGTVNVSGDSFTFNGRTVQTA